MVPSGGLVSEVERCSAFIRRKWILIDSFVCIGRNLSDQETEDIWFQFADSYAKHGSILESSGSDGRV